MTTAWTNEFTPGARRDLRAIGDFLIKSGLQGGFNTFEAVQRASQRILAIESNGLSLAKAPHRGTLHPALMENLRHITIDRAIFYFTADEETKEVRVLAIYHGGQDHGNHILGRLMKM